MRTRTAKLTVTLAADHSHPGESMQRVALLVCCKSSGIWFSKSSRGLLLEIISEKDKQLNGNPVSLSDLVAAQKFRHLWQSEDGLRGCLLFPNQIYFLGSTCEAFPKPIWTNPQLFQVRLVSFREGILNTKTIRLFKKSADFILDLFVSQGAPVLELHPRCVQVSIDEVTLNQLWKRRFEYRKICEKLQIDARIYIYIYIIYI